MARTDFDVADKTFSGEERLANLLALTRGVYTALQMALRNVRRYNDLIEDEVEDHPSAAEYLQTSQDTLERALNWLQAYERTVHGSFDTEKLDLRPMVEGVVQRCRRIAPAGVELDLSIAEEPSVVDVAVFQLQDVLLELLEGFVTQFGTEGGTITVDVSHCQLTQSDIKLSRSHCNPGLYAAVTFATAETPFAPAEQKGFLEGLLDDVEPDPEQELALLHAYGVFLRHGGDVFFGRGAHTPALTAVLPIEAKRKEMQVEPNIDDEALYGNETILLVDDEDMIWDVIIDMLQELGYSVILAGNGLEAVEIYRENPGLVDLVMLDMVMPELDGHGTFFKLKEIDPEVKVLLSSGYVSEEDARDVLDAGAAGFLQKPYRMVDLARRVRTIFDDAP